MCSDLPATDLMWNRTCHDVKQCIWNQKSHCKHHQPITDQLASARQWQQWLGSLWLADTHPVPHASSEMRWTECTSTRVRAVINVGSNNLMTSQPTNQMDSQALNADTTKQENKQQGKQNGRHLKWLNYWKPTPKCLQQTKQRQTTTGKEQVDWQQMKAKKGCVAERSQQIYRYLLCNITIQTSVHTWYKWNK